MQMIQYSIHTVTSSTYSTTYLVLHCIVHSLPYVQSTVQSSWKMARIPTAYEVQSTVQYISAAAPALDPFHIAVSVSDCVTRLTTAERYTGGPDVFDFVVLRFCGSDSVVLALRIWLCGPGLGLYFSPPFGRLFSCRLLAVYVGLRTDHNHIRWAI
jgi:hypothetical protein